MTHLFFQSFLKTLIHSSADLVKLALVIRLHCRNADLHCVADGLHSGIKTAGHLCHRAAESAEGVVHLLRELEKGGILHGNGVLQSAGEGIRIFFAVFTQLCGELGTQRTQLHVEGIVYQLIYLFVGVVPVGTFLRLQKQNEGN